MFTHLRVHSRYSLLQATAPLAELVGRARDEGLPALALTDRVGLMGVVQFRDLCQAAGIQPLIGLVVPVRPPSDLPSGLPPNARDELLLLAMNPAGYRSLSHLSSLLWSDPQREMLWQEGVDWSQLAAAGEGVLGLTGGRRGLLDQLVRLEQSAAAESYIRRLAALYPGRAYLSLELHDPAPLWEETAAEIERLGRRLGAPAVAVQPVYSLTPADRPLFRLMAAIAANRPADEIEGDLLPDGGAADVRLAWCSPAEMGAKFARFPEALAEIERVVARCGPVLPDGRPLWPVLKLAHDDKEEEPDAALRRAVEAGAAARFPDPPPASLSGRLQRELDLIGQHGYAPLFLILADVVRFARRRRIPVNTRGSVANSLVAYCLGITHVDPLAHDLLFERFLNPARRELPDIDLDFCSRRRDEILHYLRRTYGEGQVALVSTINTFQPRSAVREVAKALGFEREQIDDISRRIPHRWHPDPRRRDTTSLEELFGEDVPAAYRPVLEWAGRLVGFPHHLGLHPGGVVIAPPPDMRDVCPLHLSPKGFLATQFDFRDVEALGLVKVDLLGIRALSVIDQAARHIRRRHGGDFEIEGIPDGDAATAELLRRGRTLGVFQAESTGAMRTLRQLQAGTIRDLAVANAFFKPGPATGGMAGAFVRRYRGEEAVSFLHPSLEPILSSTKGVLLFQEQVLRIVVEVAGLDWAAANQIRKGISKFRADQIAALENRFLAGSQAVGGLNSGQAAALWQQILAFSGYGFNQGHATSYATPTYQMAYLKCHYPAEFFAARLAEVGGYHHPAVYIAEARRLGLVVRPPHVNFSLPRFTLVDDERPILWGGLGLVRDLRRAMVRAIVAARGEGPFENVRDLLRRVALQTKEVDHLIRCGALDGLGESRQALLREAEELARGGGADQLSLFPLAAEAPPQAESLARRLVWERELLGLPLSGHPVELLPPAERGTPLRQLPASAGRLVATSGVRIPGGTGGSGFYLDDGRGMVLVRSRREEERPPAWIPLRVTGRWRSDPWEGEWFQAETIEKWSPEAPSAGAERPD